MRRSGSLVVLLALAGACSATPEPAPRPPASVLVKPETTAAPAVPEEPPLTKEDWLHSAEEAEKLGAPDVANACLGRAYALEHDIPILVRWVEGLAANGEHELARQVWAAERRTAEQKGGAETVKRLDGVVAALPKADSRVSLAPGALSEAVRAAYRAGVEGRAGDAITGFSQATGAAEEPYHLAQMASFQWRKGDLVEARKAWSKARVLFWDAGAQLELIPVTDWFTSRAWWVGDKLALLRTLQPIEISSDKRLSEMQFWSVGATPEVVSSWRFASNPRAMAMSEDGTAVLFGEGSAIVVRDTVSGVALRRIETGEKELTGVVAVGAGDKLHALVSAGSSVKLWDATGKLVNDYTLEGTTPTITRVYRTGQGAVHDNILRDSPTWAVSLALSSDLRFAAAGGSDSKVRLFDRRSGKKRDLEYKWSYVEHRHMGGNPDLNVPVDMRFSEKGDRLVVVYRHGDLITWSTAAGQTPRILPGTCSVEEATVVVNRYKSPGDPSQAPTTEDREGCGRPQEALFDPGLKLLVTSGAAVRVRELIAGTGLALWLDDGPSDDYLAWSRTGTLATANLYGAVSLWSPGDKAARRVVKANPSSPIDPYLSANGRLLWFDRESRAILWDPVARKEISLGAAAREILGAAEDGSLVARRLSEAVEIVDVATGSVVLKRPVPKDDPVWAYVAGAGKKVLLREQHTPPINVQDRAPMKLVLCDVAKGACDEWKFGAATGMLDISEDGRWIVAETASGELSVWDAASGKVAVSMGRWIVDVAFAKGGGAVAWIEHPDREERRVIAHFHRLDPSSEAQGPTGTRSADVAPAYELDLDGWPSDVAVSPDGAEVWILLQSKLFRWKPGADNGVAFEDLSIIGARKVQVGDNQKTILLTGYDRIAIRANDLSLRPLASLYPLLSGGYLVVSAEGAVEGTADAPDSLVARVARDKETLAFEGRLGWDAAHFEGVLRRALAGIATEPPVPTANGLGATSL